jgi:fatty-acyl-CoA synthase
MLRGLMMDTSLLISSLIEHAATNTGRIEIVSRSVEGPIHRYTYADAGRRSRQLANALTALGVQPGDRIGTLAWNTWRHFEIYYGVSGMGAVCHTINPRLFPPQIAYIINHAEDAWLFVDLTFLPLVEGLADKLPSVKGVVVLTDADHMPAACKLPGLLCYETLVAGQPDTFDWPRLDEWTASSLCYTSGTTGNPRGVLFSHRSTVLHALGAVIPNGFDLSFQDAVMPVVPMFHANAWGLPYIAAIAGAKLVFPGPRLDGASLHELMEAEKVTFSAGVPTIWMSLLAHLEKTGGRFSTLKRTVIGGSAAPRSMIETFKDRYGVEIIHAWGMTEMSPLGTMCKLLPHMDDWPETEKNRIRAKQGRLLYGVEMTITDDAGAPLAHDGLTAGHLRVRGPWICSRYFGEDLDAAHADGWFDTGDVATIDADGYMQVTDRAKDLIKSGGEWISSIELENIAVAHPDVAEAAAIAIAHPQWSERPILIVVRKPGTALDRAGMLAFLSDKMADWWMPDDVVFVEGLPHTATGKLLKSKLREQFKDYRLPASA